MATFHLRDVSIIAVSICKGPANRKRIFLKKSDVSADALIESPAPHTIMRKADGDSWKVFYSVVAQPDWEEKPGSGDGAQQGTTDMWESPEEILKAAHSFMRSGALINLQHADLNAVGRVVENFVAPADFEVLGPDGVKEEIKKGSWVIGIEPDEQLRAAIDDGSLDGVSYEGTGVRVAVEKDADTGGTHRSCGSCKAKMGRTASKCPACGASYVSKASAGTLRHEPTVAPGGPGLFGMKGAQLPAYIQHVFNDLVEKGSPHSGRTYSLAVGIVRNWSHGHDGKGNKVSAQVQAKAVAAMAEWESLKVRAKSDNIKKALRPDAGTLTKETNMKLIHRIAKQVGLSDAEIEAALTDEESDLVSKVIEQEDEVSLTDAEKQSLAKVEGIESQVTDLVKDDGRLSRVEAALARIEEALPKKEKSDEERRTEVETQVAELAKSLEKAQDDLDKLSEGGTSQDDTADTLKKTDDPDALLAAALFGD